MTTFAMKHVMRYLGKTKDGRELWRGTGLETDPGSMTEIRGSYNFHSAKRTKFRLPNAQWAIEALRYSPPLVLLCAMPAWVCLWGKTQNALIILPALIIYALVFTAALKWSFDWSYGDQ